MHRIPQIKAVNGIKMKSNRVQCDPDLIDLFYDELEELLSLGIPSAFIINIDESGYCDWIDTNDTKVLVPFDFERNEIEIPVDRCSKRASMVAGICADGSHITNGFVIPRKTIETELYECGYTKEKVSI